jgi:hypothetical protein
VDSLFTTQTTTKIERFYRVPCSKKVRDNKYNNENQRGCFMLRKRRQSKRLWQNTAAFRRKRKLMYSKKKIFSRHRAFVQLSTAE